MHIPQIVVLFLFSAEVLLATMNAGKEGKSVLFWGKFIYTSIIVTNLIWGGFFK